MATDFTGIYACLLNWLYATGGQELFHFTSTINSFWTTGMKVVDTFDSRHDINGANTTISLITKLPTTA